MRLDPSDGEVQTALGFVRFRIDWDWRAAEAAFVRACELSPGHAPAHHRLALLLSALGRHDEALVEIRRAHELDPLSLIIGTARGTRAALPAPLRRRDRAGAADAPHGRALRPGALRSRHGLRPGRPSRRGHRPVRIRAAARRSAQRHARAVLGHIYARAGRAAQAEEVLHDLERRYRRGDASSYDLSLALIGLGRAAEGLDWLERACETRSGLLVYLKVEPMFDSIRGEPRFAALMQRLAFL